LRGLASPLAIRNQIWLGSFTQQELQSLLAKGWQDTIDQVYEPVHSINQRLDNLAVADQVSLLTIKHYLHNGILTKLDRATMFTNLEARTPFLDSDVAEFALRLPVHYKRDKKILRELMRGRIPDFVIDRPKQGFALPLGTWLRGPLAEFMHRTLAEEKLSADNIFQPTEVARLKREHISGAADHRKKLWTLIAFQLWYDHWVMSRPLNL